MLEKLASKIEELVNKQVEPEIITYEGVDYIKTASGFERLRKPSVQHIRANSLTGLMEFVKTTVQESDNLRFPLLISINVNTIQVFTSLADDKSREMILEVNPLVPDLQLGYGISVEEMIILLSTAYVPTDNTEKFISSISTLRMVEEVEFSDNGIGQTVTAKQGASVNKVYEVQPIVKLKPIRTYAEIDQVESKFLFRVNKNGSVKLIEADGGQWKYEVQTRIAECLFEYLKDYITAGTVRIIG